MRPTAHSSVRFKVFGGVRRGMHPLAVGLNQAVQQAFCGCGTLQKGRSGVSAGESGWLRPRVRLGGLAVSISVTSASMVRWPVAVAIDTQ